MPSVPEIAPLRKGDGPPRELADRWEHIVREVGHRQFEKMKGIRKAIGQRPYKGVSASQKDMENRYGQIRHDPQALLDTLLDNAKFKTDGRVLLPKALIKQITEMEQRFRDGGYE